MVWKRIAASFAIGGLAGAALVASMDVDEAQRATDADQVVPQSIVGSSDAEARVSLDASDVVPAPRERVGAPAEVDGAQDANELISRALREHARAGIAAGWALVRSGPIDDAHSVEGVGTFEKLVRESPHAIGKKLGERETARERSAEDARAGGAIALLDRLAAGGVGPLSSLAGDASEFSKLFGSPQQGPVRDGLADLARPDSGLVDGATLQYPAGVFRLARLMKDKSPFPRDITIAGAGMNATLLLVGGLDTREDLRNLTFRDCTLHTQDDSLFDLRRRPATVQLSRARLVGFDSGAGGSSAIDAKGFALYARSSIIEGGYGRSPAHGRLFDVRSDALLTRFESCTIDALTLGHERLHAGATVVFANCALTNLLDAHLPTDGSPPGLAFLGSRVSLYAGDRNDPPRKDLNELFPNWRERIDR